MYMVRDIFEGDYLGIVGEVMTESRLYNAYCDESCHFEHNGIPVMALGADLPRARVRDVAVSLCESASKGVKR